MQEHCYIQQFSIVLQKNKIDFFTKICNKFVIMNNWQDARNFFKFSIAFSENR